MLFSLVVPIVCSPVCSPVCLGVVRLSVPGNEEQNTQIQNFTLTTKRICQCHSILLCCYGQIYFNIFRYILQKAGLIWFNTSQTKNKNIFINDMTWAIPSLRSEKFRKPEPPEKSVSFRKCDFSGAQAFPRSFWSRSP